MTIQTGGRFSEEVCNKLGNYVYRLIDPRNGETFYVGRGRNNRVFDHAEGVRDIQSEEIQALNSKYERIRAIKDAHLQVIHVIHRHDIKAEAINDVEAAVIDAYPGLTNLQGGYASNDTGPMNYIEIINKYNLPELPADPQHRLLLININRLEDRSDVEAVYNQVRYSWRVSKDRVVKAEYVLAVVRGVVVGAFRPNTWLHALPENFPELKSDGSEPYRLGFHGEIAESAIWDLYVGKHGKQIVQADLRHSQNPVRYWKC